MIKITVTFFAVILFSLHLQAQDTIPVLKGKVNISIAKGTMECNFILSNIPRINDYYIRLNSGMNIRNIKNPYGLNSLHYEKSLEDTLSTGEATAYYLKGYNAFRKFLPKAIQFSYVGMYPVIADTVSADDWKGNIAFNGNTIRTDGSQTAWYPILYDIKKDLKYDKVAYDIEVNCEDCKTIYLNGSVPVESKHANFKSDLPQELTMFAGNYKMVAINGNYFLNPDMDDDQIKAFEAIIHTYKSYFEKNLIIPYKGNAVYIQTTPVAKNVSWLYASYPSIVNIGFGDAGMKTFFDKKKGDRFKPYFAHELGHSYFGTYRDFNSELGDMISEGFAEYLSLTITKKLISDSVYKKVIESKFQSLHNFNSPPVPFAAVKSHNDYDNRDLYVYYYAPLIFTAIEKEIGEETMWKWLRSILQTPATFTNYHFLEQTLSRVLNDTAKFNLIRSKYFTADSVIKNVSATLGINNTIQTAVPATQQVVKTYYFLISRPLLDAGSPDNRTILHTEILETTCTQAELFKKMQPVFIKMKESCQNEEGCTRDLNMYETLDKAKEAYQRWLKPFAGNPNFVIKTISL